MIAFKFNFKQVVGDMQRTLRQKEIKYSDEYRELVTATLRLLAENSPQYSGYFAAMWRVRSRQIGVGRREGKIAQVFSDYSEPLTYDQFKAGPWTMKNPKWIGDQEAVNFALAANEKFIKAITIRSRPEFYNDVDYYKYIAYNKDEEGKPFLRAYNYAGKTPYPTEVVKNKLWVYIRE